MSNICFENSIADIREKICKKQISSLEICQQLADWIKRHESSLNAMIAMDVDQVIEKAKEADQRISQGETSDLLGVPVVVKDNIVTKNFKTTAASRMLENYQSVYDATVVSKLEEVGAIIIGKANLDEFAMGSSCENSYFGTSKNPWDISRVPGGSSGGSAVAVAAGYSWASLGSDTGGSIRLPASMCGVVGLKPTYGRVSRYGLISLASSLDQIGPFARRVEDVALMLKVVSGWDKKDSTSSQKDVDDYLSDIGNSIKGWKVAVLKELYDGVEEGVRKLFDSAIVKFKEMGVEVEEVSMPILEYSLPVYYIIQPCETSTNLARYDGIRYGYCSQTDDSKDWDRYELTRKEGFGREVKRRIMLGNFALSSGYYDDYFNKASKVRAMIVEEYKKIFDSYDFILGLTSPFPAFRIGEKVDDPLSMYLSDVMTISINLAGIPSVSIPMGFIDGLPMGMQLIGGWYDEKKILQAAYNYQQITDWHLQVPQYIKEKMEV